MQQQQDFMTQLLLQNQRFMQDQIQQSHPPPPEDPDRAFHAFLKMKTPVYKGSRNPMEAQSWLYEMTKIFELAHYFDEQKVSFASHMLQAEAEIWWKGARAYLINEGTQLNWETFSTTFLDKYFPESTRLQKENEFAELKQGDLSMVEYVKKFEDLAQYAEQAQYAPNEQWKIKSLWGVWISKLSTVWALLQ